MLTFINNSSLLPQVTNKLWSTDEWTKKSRHLFWGYTEESLIDKFIKKQDSNIIAENFFNAKAILK